MLAAGASSGSRLALVALAGACVLASACKAERSRPRKPYDWGHFDYGANDPGETKPATEPDRDEAEEDGPYDDSAGRVYSKARFLWIRRKPDGDSDWLGYITLGQSIAIRRDARGSVDDGAGCSWVAVQPKGWVCVGRDATLDPKDSTFTILRERTADVESPFPFRYARSLGGPRYRTLPTARDQRMKEGNIAALLEKIEKARMAKGEAAIAAIDKRLVGAELGLANAPPPPAFEPSHAIMETDEDLELGSTLAYTYEFDYDHRAFLLGWDFSLIPSVRTAKYPRSAFHGVELGADVDLPVAFVRKQGAYRYRIDVNGEVVRADQAFEPHQMVALGHGPTLESEGRKLYPTREEGVYVSEKDAVIVSPNGEMPANVPSTGRRTWIEVSTVGGWLVAYEGHKPVFATAISAGRAALAPDGTMVPSSSTPLGTYTIKNKMKTATMRSDRQPNRVHAEVMYTQVFHEDYALHGAYWHDDFGDRRSAGCVNLSPIDSKWVFDWSEPKMPRDWHVKKVDGNDLATVVVIHL